MSIANEKTQSATNRLPLRFRWSRRGKLHRGLVKSLNTFLGMCPFQLKYGIGKAMRRSKAPYKLIKSGSNIVQIGAPADTLKAGRSRGMYFSLFNGPSGKTVIIEPAEASEVAFNRCKQKHSLNDLVFVRSGAWSEKKNLKLFVDPSHPATNFTEGTVDYTPERIAEFQEINIPCDTVDNLLAQANVSNVDIISITTNGAVREILSGMEKTLEAGVRFICLARHAYIGDFGELMKSYGYTEYSFDDRGTTYQKISS